MIFSLIWIGGALAAFIAFIAVAIMSRPAKKEVPDQPMTGPNSMDNVSLDDDMGGFGDDGFGNANGNMNVDEDAFR